MNTLSDGLKHAASRRSLLGKAAIATATGLLPANLQGSGSNEHGHEEKSGKLTKGDAALLRFVAAAEIIESDFWIQYNELGGIPDNEVSGGSGNPVYTEALEKLDEDFPQYIHDNTDDEITHLTFLNAYLASKGAHVVNLDAFRTLPGSTATGSSGKPRLNKSDATDSRYELVDTIPQQ